MKMITKGRVMVGLSLITIALSLCSPCNATTLFKLGYDSTTGTWIDTSLSNISVYEKNDVVPRLDMTSPTGGIVAEFSGLQSWLEFTGTILPANFTIEFYLQTTGFTHWSPGERYEFRHHVYGADGAGGNIDVDLHDKDCGNCAVWTYFASEGALNIIDTRDSSVIEDGVWHRYVMTRDANTITVAIDNRLIGEEVFSGPAEFFSGTSFIGRASNFTDEVFPGFYGNFSYEGYMAGFQITDTFTEITPVPEPATMLLFATGIAGIAGTRMRRRKK